MSPWMAFLANAEKTDPAAMVFIGALVVPFLIAATVLVLRPEAKERMQVFAERLEGTATGGSIFELPSVEFRIQGLEATIEFAEHRDAMTRLRVRIPQFKEGSLRIVSETAARSLGCAAERRTPVGDRFFDATYRVEAGPRALVSRMFSPERRSMLIKTIRRLGRPKGFELTLEPGRLQIRLSDCLMEVPAVLDLAGVATGLVESLLGVGGPEMQWGDVVEQMTGRCPICSTALQVPLVRCSRCRSPHHRDCWKYLGRCATFGCDPKSRRSAA